MSSKEIRYLLITILLTIFGIGLFLVKIIYDLPFGIGGLGIAIAGIAIELYIKNKHDSVTEHGEKRSDIEAKDERIILINAKTGQLSHTIISCLIFIGAVLSVYLNLSSATQLLVFTLLILNLIIPMFVKKYFDNKL